MFVLNRRITYKKVLLALFAVVALFMITTAESCDETKPEAQRRTSIQTRADTFDRAQKVVPLPNNNNFPLRKTLAAMTERDDLVNHPWFVYVLGLNGNIIGYYVAKTDPVNACNFLSSTEDDQGFTAPSLDGIFYGGGGSSAACDAWVFLDQATNALIKVRGLPFYVADQPLRVDAKPIKVK